MASSSKTGLLAAAFTAHLGIAIKSEEEAERLKIAPRWRSRPVDTWKLDMTALYKFTHHRVVMDGTLHTLQDFGQAISDTRSSYASPRLYQYSVNPAETVNNITKVLPTQFGGKYNRTLWYNGRRLAAHMNPIQQGVPAGASLVAAWGPEGDGPEPVFYISDTDLDPKFDYDFTNVSDDGVEFKRGHYEYKRPCGWDRCALKVLGKFPPDDKWLGQPGMRTKSSPEEWVVSYHGTPVANLGSIAESGFDRSKSKRELFGPGIYSTPSIDVAARYAAQFEYEEKKYKVVLQNRVNLDKSNEIPASETHAGAPYFVTEDEDEIRPYGVCLKEI